MSLGDITGVTVHAASRLESFAAANEIVVSRTVRDLVGPSTVGFVERGRHELKGLDGAWELFALD